MSATLHELRVNDRVIVVPRGAESPYCIIRCLEIDESLRQTVTLWFSFLKQGVRLGRGETMVPPLVLNGEEISVKFAHSHWNKANVEITTPETFQVRRLYRRQRVDA